MTEAPKGGSTPTTTVVSAGQTATGVAAPSVGKAGSTPGPRPRRRTTPPPTPHEAALRAAHITAARKPTTQPGSQPASSSPASWPIPGSTRVPLSSSGQHLGGVRVALADGDVTRADAIAQALRARRAQVQLVSVDPNRTHWLLLRKFAPHALVLDERAISGDGERFLRRFRRDPFLAHTQLLSPRLDRLFRPATGAASIETLRPMLEPLSQLESELVAKLAAGWEVQLDLDQLPPHVLLKVLSQRAKPTRITCRRGKESFEWTLAGQKAGVARLFDERTGNERALDADGALEWLLRHENCEVVLGDVEAPADLSQEEVVRLVERKISGTWKMDSTSTSKSAAFEELSWPDPRRSRGHSLSPSVSSRHPTRSRSEQRRRRSDRWSNRTGLVLAGGALVVAGAVAAATVERMSRTPGSVEPVQVTLPDVPELTAPGGGAAPDAGAPEAPIAPSPSRSDVGVDPSSDVEGTRPADEAGVTAPEPQDALAALLRASEQPGPECESDGTEPSGNDGDRLARIHVARAQAAMVEGRNADAHEQLCTAVRLEPAGRGAKLLAQYYLGQRQLERARMVLAPVMKGEGRAQALELAGDIENQLGNVERSRQLWLEMLGVEPTDAERLCAVARVWVGHARTAMKHGDLPRAERAARRALTICDRNRAAAAVLASVLTRRQQPERAKQLLEYAETLD